MNQTCLNRGVNVSNHKQGAMLLSNSHSAGCSRFLPIRLFLKRIIPVRAPAAEQEPEGAEEVGGDEEEAPAFVLADVDPLVGAGGVEVLRGAGQDGVAEGDGGCSAQERGAAEEPGRDG